MHIASHIKIRRIYDTDCTIGMLSFGSFRCMTLELPWLDNQQDISCYPTGIYQWRKITSPSLGKCIDIINVLDRTYIRMHAGNFTRQIRGCTLIGEYVKDIDGDGIPDVANSRRTLSKLMSLLPDSGTLEVS